MKHKHAELIHAWAEGAEIQCSLSVGSWVDDKMPSWTESFEYRIKPEEKKPVVRWLWAIDKGNGFELHPIFVEDKHIPYPAVRHAAMRLDWSRTEFEK